MACPQSREYAAGRTGMGTLKEDMADDFANVILDEDEFAETVTHYPRGNLEAGVAVVAKVERHEEAGRALNSYAPPQKTNDADGEEIVRWVRVHVPATLDVTDEERGAQRDAFMIGGELFRVLQIVGRTSYRLSVFCERRVPITTKRK